MAELTMTFNRVVCKYFFLGKQSNTQAIVNNSYRG